MGTSYVIVSENLGAFKPHLPFFEKLRVVISFSVLTTEQTPWRFSFRITNLYKKNVENSVITCLLRTVTRNFKIQCNHLLSFVGFRHGNRNSCASQEIWELRLLNGSWNA